MFIVLLAIGIMIFCWLIFVLESILKWGLIILGIIFLVFIIKAIIDKKKE